MTDEMAGYGIPELGNAGDYLTPPDGEDLPRWAKVLISAVALAILVTIAILYF